MSQNPRPAAPDPAAARARARSRDASVTLRSESGGADMTAMMDPATHALGQAVKTTYRLVLLAMLVLGVLYILSGFQVVREGERGMRIVFGSVVSDDLAPGFQWGLPQGIGEIETVNISGESVEIAKAFWPNLSGEQEKAVREGGLQRLAGMGNTFLNPEEDGYLLTADGNIVHTQWTASYRRENPKMFRMNIHPDAEQEILAATIQSAVVEVIAQTPIEEVLRSGELEEIARREAQASLDELDSGLQITSLKLTQRSPPMNVLTAFNKVESSRSQGESAIQAASKDATNLLQGAAGNASRVLIDLIERYERELDAGEDAAAAETLAKIDAVLVGEPVEIDGQMVTPELYGTAQEMMRRAVAEGEAAASEARSSLARYDALCEAYAANPEATLVGETLAAIRGLVSGDTVETHLLPPGPQLVMLMNRDPNIKAALEEQRNYIRAQQSLEKRRREFEREKFEGRRAPSAPADSR